MVTSFNFWFKSPSSGTDEGTKCCWTGSQRHPRAGYPRSSIYPDTTGVTTLLRTLTMHELGITFQLANKLRYGYSSRVLARSCSAPTTSLNHYLHLHCEIVMSPSRTDSQPLLVSLQSVLNCGHPPFFTMVYGIITDKCSHHAHLSLLAVDGSER